MKIGFIHPGAMGISLAVSAQVTGHEACWVPTDRSPETINRAQEYGLTEFQSLAELCEECSIIISVCPPHAALDVAQQVLDASFQGIYADANAIAPEKTRSMEQMMCVPGIEFVDGGIIGGPAWQPESTWLYLSGPQANQVSDCFSEGLIETELLGNEIGKASAIKMCFAAYTKGITALLCAIMAAADDLGVRSELEQQWSKNGSDFAERTRNRITRVTAKAWRFSGEMKEIAATLESTGLPPEFHLAASDIYRRISKFKGAEPTPSIEEVLAALKSGNQDL